ncbi:MAG TPA: aldehyde dehydrogenase family protein [Capillimicrobium sp.]|nr:aldehyde dehydrogenase family protein [Capillimicrobium sp.]
MTQTQDIQTREVISPATGEVLGRLPLGTAADVDAAVSAAAGAARELAALGPFERADLCDAVADAVEARADEIARLLALEHGKPLEAEARGEVAVFSVAFREAAQQVRWMTGEVVPAHDETKRVLVQRRPLGVYGVISPWNFPLGVPSLYYLGPGLAAGNAVVWTPAPSTSLVALAVADAIADAGVLPAGALTVVTGEGPVVGDALARHPGVHGVGFTGSTGVGEAVARAAAGKPVLLELGGNGPTIVLEDADLDLAAAAIAGSSFANAGQVCTATGRVLAHESVAGELAERLARHAGEIVLGLPLDAATTMGPVHQEPLADRIVGQLDQAVAAGAQVVAGGRRREDLPTRNYLEPTVVDRVPAGASLHVDETFGPVAPIVRFGSTDELRELVDASPFGLFSALFSRDVARAMRLAERLPTGTVNINAPSNYWEPHLPAGGAAGRASGIGRAGGRWSIDAMSEVHTITVSLPEREDGWR